jgi:hypothetical protein
MINIYSLLNPVSGIQSIVGQSTSPQSSRIYPGLSDETAALPLIEYSTVSQEPFSTLYGVGDPHRVRMQISCHAATYDGAQALADAVHAALEGNGYMEFRSDGYEQETKTYSVFIDWSFQT